MNASEPRFYLSWSSGLAYSIVTASAELDQAAEKRVASAPRSHCHPLELVEVACRSVDLECPWVVVAPGSLVVPWAGLVHPPSLLRPSFLVVRDSWPPRCDWDSWDLSVSYLPYLDPQYSQHELPKENEAAKDKRRVMAVNIPSPGAGDPGMPAI